MTRWRHQWRHEYGLYKCSHNLMIHMHRKFNDDILFVLVIMKNIVISFTKEYRGPTLRPHCEVIDDVIIFCIIWGDLFISEVKLKLGLIFQNFQNGCRFELVTNSLSEMIPEVEYTRKIASSISDIIELLINALAEILTKIYQFKNLICSVTRWRSANELRPLQCDLVSHWLSPRLEWFLKNFCSDGIYRLYNISFLWLWEVVAGAVIIVSLAVSGMTGTEIE